MIGFVFLGLVFLDGLFLARIFNIKDKLINAISAFILGSVLSVSLLYIVTSYLTHDLHKSLLFFFIISFILLVLKVRSIKNILFEARNMRSPTTVISILFFVLSYYIMNKSFSYDQGNFLISSNTYLDFGAHIPFVRSFSLGNNFPAEIPFFGNSNLVYHFMFDFYVGILEYLGLNISLAFNLISAIFFTLLLLIIFRLGMLFFESKAVGLLSVIFFLFTPSISFISFFVDKGISFREIWNNSVFLLDSPFGNNTISVFWTLNTFINQRHLIVALAAVLLLVYFIYTSVNKKISVFQAIILGSLIGLMPFWNTQIFLSGLIIIAMSLVIMPINRKGYVYMLFTAIIISSPQLFSIIKNSDNSIIFNPGFMVADNLSISSFSKYWIANFGLSISFFIIGIWKAGRAKGSLLILFLPLFILPNIFQFTKDIFDNHKFLNLWIISFYFYASYAIIYLFKKNHIYKLFIPPLICIFLFSGFLNFLTIKNDVRELIPDYKSNGITKFIQVNIPMDSLVLTNGEIYDPASIAGKKTYLGRSHYIFLYGGNPEERLTKRRIMFETQDIKRLRNILKEEEISYIIIYKDDFAKNSIIMNINHFEDFQLIYSDDKGSIFKI